MLAQSNKDTSIVAHYRHLLETDHEINQPIAAVESLIALLSASPPSTVSETLTLIESATTTLKSSTPNPISLSAGTDLFRRYIISSLQGSAPNFDTIRSHLLSNSKLFVESAKEARSSIARLARQLIQDGTTVLISGYSRVLKTVLHAAADHGTAFRVVHVRSTRYAPEDAHARFLDELRRKHVPVAEIDHQALAVAARASTFALVGAESVVENGGIISAMGTEQIGILMKNLDKQLYVAAESHKFVRFYPLSSKDIGLEDGVLKFNGDESTPKIKETGSEPAATLKTRLEFTPPELITALITESGIHRPNAVSEELLKAWY